MSPPPCPIAAFALSTVSICFSLCLRQGCRLLALHWCSREATIIQIDRELFLLQDKEKMLSASAPSQAMQLPPLLSGELSLFKKGANALEVGGWRMV